MPIFFLFLSLSCRYQTAWAEVESAAMSFSIYSWKYGNSAWSLNIHLRKSPVNSSMLGKNLVPPDFNLSWEITANYKHSGFKEPTNQYVHFPDWLWTAGNEDLQSTCNHSAMTALFYVCKQDDWLYMDKEASL